MKDKKIILNIENVKKVAKLANLTISDGEADILRGQLSAVVDYVDQLSEIDTKDIEPTSQVTGLENVLREDEVDESLTQDDALSGTENKNQDYFKVKAVFNNE